MTDETLTLSREQLNDWVPKVKEYLEVEHQLALGQFDVEFLIEFIVKLVGPALFDLGVEQALARVESKFLDLQDELNYLKHQ